MCKLVSATLFPVPEPVDIASSHLLMGRLRARGLLVRKTKDMFILLNLKLNS